MWRPQRLYIQNLGSHLETEYKFVSGKPTLIQGVNLDDSEQESNGSGKSILIDACAYALTGSFLRKVRDEEMINDDSSSALIRMTLSNQRTKQELIVTRRLHRKKTSELEIEVNGVSQSDKFSSINDGNTFLLDLIGVRKEDLLNFYLISKEKYVSFYRSSDNDKKGVISRFSNANLIEGVDKLIQIEVDEIDTKLRDLQLQLENIDAQITTYEQVVTDIYSNHDRDIQVETEQLKLKIKKLEEANVQLLENINTHKSVIKKEQERKKAFDEILQALQNEIDSFQAISFDKEIQDIVDKQQKILQEQGKVDEKRAKMEAQKQSYLDEIKELQVLFLEINHKKQDLLNLLAGKITCPKCTHEFVLRKGVDVKEVEAQVKEYESDLAIVEQEKKEIQLKIDNLDFNQFNIDKLKLQEQYKNLGKEKDSYVDKIAKHNKKLQDLRVSFSQHEKDKFTIERTIREKENEIASFQTQIDTNVSLIIKYTEQAEALKSVTVEEKTRAYNEKIKELRNSIPVIKEEIESLEHDRYVKSEWVQHFKRFRTHLANKAIKNIEGYINLFLKKMGSNLQVEIEGYKTLSTGEVREKINPNVLRNGRMFGNFYKCSGGERGRIEMGTLLSEQTLINLSSPTGGLDLLFVDEILDSVDSRGFQSMAKSLSGLHKTVLLISHVPISSNESYNLITVEKSNRSSKIR